LAADDVLRSLVMEEHLEGSAGKGGPGAAAGFEDGRAGRQSDCGSLAAAAAREV
jgi:hypothetical protein